MKNAYSVLWCFLRSFFYEPFKLHWFVANVAQDVVAFHLLDLINIFLFKLLRCGNVYFFSFGQGFPRPSAHNQICGFVISNTDNYTDRFDKELCFKSKAGHCSGAGRAGASSGI